jgi:hypothetical protein
MFALTPQDLRGRILDCGAGPASFNAEATAAGHRISSCDPLYRFSAADIRRRVEETSETLLAAVREHSERFVWRDIESPEKLGELRFAARSGHSGFRRDRPAGMSSYPSPRVDVARS